MCLPCLCLLAMKNFDFHHKHDLSPPLHYQKDWFQSSILLFLRHAVKQRRAARNCLLLASGARVFRMKRSSSPVPSLLFSKATVRNVHLQPPQHSGFTSICSSPSTAPTQQEAKKPPHKSHIMNLGKRKRACDVCSAKPGTEGNLLVYFVEKTDSPQQATVVELR